VNVPDVGTLGPSNCGLPEFPATTLPVLGPMTYWGGWVQTHPKEYLVLWGWDEKGAFPGQKCGQDETLTQAPDADGTNPTLGCDPDGAGKYMANFLSEIPGTDWATSQDQYYQNNADGSTSYIDETGKMLSGIWVDNDSDANLANTSSDNTGDGPTGNTYTDMALEAQRAAQHFGITGAALKNANFIIAQAPAFSDPNALNVGYCAFHDYTDPNSPGNT
jgi:hypothetical protein